MALLQLGLATFYLYILLNWSAFVGFTIILCLMPVPGYIGKLIAEVRRKKMEGRGAWIRCETCSFIAHAWHCLARVHN